MADGIELDAGSGGAIAATDDCGAAGHTQIVKLGISTDGSATLIPAEATNGLDVDVTRVIPGTSATHLGKAEDAAHSSGDTGVMGLTVRQDTAAALGQTDGDYQPLVTDSTGRLHCNVSNTLTVASHAVTNAGTFAVQASLSAAIPAGTNNIGDVDVLSMVPGTAATNLGKAEDAAHASGDVGVMALAVRSDTPAALGADGDYMPPLVDSTGRLHCNVSNTLTVASHAVTNDGTFAVQVSSLPASTNTIEVVGDAAHGATAAGNPVLIGIEGRSTAPTAVDDGDVVRALASLLGKQVMLPYALPANTWSYASPAAVTDTSDDEAKAAVASTRHYITGVQVFNGHDTTGTEVVIKDGSTVLWRGWAEQTGGGCSAKFDPPLRGTANTAVNVANITTSSSTYFNLQGFSATE